MTELGLVGRNLFRHRLRTALMMISIFITFALFGILGSFHRALDEDSDTASAWRLVVVNAINFTQPLPLAYVDRIRALPGADEVAHASWFGGYHQDPRRLVSTVAVPPRTYLSVCGDDLVIDDAARRAFISDRAAALVGEGVAAKMGWSVGDDVPISSNIYVKADGSRTWRFRIAGIVRSRHASATANVVLMNYDYLNENRTFAKDKISWLLVAPAKTTAAGDLAAAIDRTFENSAAETATVSEKSFNREFTAQFRNLGQLIFLIVGCALVTLLLIVGSTMAMSVRERLNEIGILKTIGFSNGRVLRMIVMETTLLALLGGLPGCAAAFAAVTLAHGTLTAIAPGLAFTPLLAAVVVGSVVLFGLAAGWVPGLAVLRSPAGAAIGAS